jgi:hypothetical protein
MFNKIKIKVGLHVWMNWQTELAEAAKIYLSIGLSIY